VGPANRDLLYVIWRSPSPAPCCCLHGWEDNVRIYNLDAVVCCLAGTVTAVNVTQQWCCAATVGRDSDRHGGSADPPRRWLCVPCGSARLSCYSPSLRRARRHDGTARRWRTVHGDMTRRLGNRRAYRGVSLPVPCVSGKPRVLTWGVPGPATALNAGRWAGDPRRASCHMHVAGPAPLPPQGGTWRHQTPPRREGGPGLRGRLEQSGP
jgi:hypothetical protein